MKGICDKCSNGIKSIPGAQVYCPHNQTGGVYLDIGAQVVWLLYTPITEGAFRAVTGTLKIAASLIETEVSKEIPKKPETND